MSRITFLIGSKYQICVIITPRSSPFPLHCISGNALHYIVLDTIPKFYLNILLKNNLMDDKILKLSPLDPATIEVLNF